MTYLGLSLAAIGLLIIGFNRSENRATDILGVWITLVGLAVISWGW